MCVCVCVCVCVCMCVCVCAYLHRHCLFVCLFVFNVPSTARSFRDGTPIYCPLRRTGSSVNTPSRPGIEPGAVAWHTDIHHFIAF